MATAAIQFDAGAPRSVADLYDRHYREQRDKGKLHEQSHRYALAMVRHSGWYKTAGGKWKQLTPDLRNKVNVREAVKQPDGTYVIEGVDAFYPNAAKGKALKFGADDVRDMIQNTNRGIHAGGQKPGLIEGHPNDMQAALGTQLDALGSGINWRESPRGPGWARCDLVGVDPHAVDRIQKRRLTGLSAGIAKDASGLNRRFGHVALLGGTTQALSHLPVTEIYSVSNQICFSADETFHAKGKIMKGKLKDCYDSLSGAYAAYEAAMASHEAGEPGSVEKLREAGSKWKAAAEAVKGMEDPEGDAEYDAGGEPDAPLATSPDAVPGNAPTPTAAYESIDGLNFEANPEGAFYALAGMVKTERAANKTLIANLRAVTKVAEGLTGRVLRTDFNAEIEKLERDGHILPGKAEIDAEFSACAESRDPKKSLERVIKTFKSLPKKPSPAATGRVFGADEAATAAEPNFSSDDEVNASLKRVQSILGSASFTEQETAMGRATARSHLPVK